MSKKLRKILSKLQVSMIDQQAEDLIEQAVQQLEQIITRRVIEELENLPPYMYDAYPSIKDRLQQLKENEKY